MDTFFHQLLGGLATGGIYAAVALALVMIYEATHQINLAQGEMAMLSTFIAWSFIEGGVPYWISFVLTIGLSFVFGVLIERAVMRPLSNAPHLTVVMVLIGLLIVLNSVAGLVFGHTAKTFPSPFEGVFQFGGGYLSSHEIGSILVCLTTLALVYSFLSFTSLGLAMRAVAQNPTSSRLVGIRVGWMLALGWGLSAAIGAVAGMMIAPSVYLDPNMMAGVLLYAFAAALLGGIDNPTGAVVGGFAVGVFENLAGAYIVGTELKLTVALVVIIGVLLFRPSGLMGRKQVTRV